ncbi:transmembrane protein 132E isoform X1 [Salmo salar]|uniref:Transmembrane protein 132E n=2 Tax=Salmo TaxID=8028 RepID=A0A673X870_SALTR|nr:transmembrane protein 132E-like isoform X1 [Salmo salar]XP_029546498.1 transmembrane protein 132E-like isoform X1 [Salmo trutta]|eukprot:XP_013992491.1 PREDICTED: transmembrane protein 132E-like isoform X1 [Salmo salar]
MGLLISDLVCLERIWHIYFMFLVLLITFAGKVSPTSSDALLSSSAVTPTPPDIYLPANFKLSNAQLAFFLRETRSSGQSSSSPANKHPLQRSESFVVFQTKEFPAVNITFGPFTQDQSLSKDLLQPSSPLDILGRLTVNWKVRAFIVQSRVLSSNPMVQVLFYIAGRDWDDFKVQDKLPCVRLHGFRDVREIKTSCRLRGNLAQCLAQLELPPTWFNTNVAPLGRRKSSSDSLVLELSGESLQAELYYTLHDPDSGGECGESSGRRGGSRGEPPSQHPLLRIGSISLYHSSQKQLVVDKQLDKNMFLRLPEKSLKPGETLNIFLYLVPNSTVEQFTLKVKAKKGVNLLQTKSKNAQWTVDWEVQSGAKHSITTINVNKNKGVQAGDALANIEVMQLDFEMENFTSQSVTRRINWNIDYRGQNPPPDSEKVVTELTVVQKDIQAIIPLSMDTEIINTAILTGRTVAIPVKVVSIEMSGVVTDVSSFVECKSSNEDIVKVSMNCDYVFVNGKETRGSMNARVIFSYEHLSAPLELTVWVPKLPLQVELSDSNLSFIKGWRVPILPDRRSARDSDVDDDEDDRRVSRGCTLQYQRTLVKVLTQFHTTSTEGTDQVITMLGPDWQVDVTDLVQDSLKVVDPRIAELVDRTVLVGLELGSTVLKVESPLAVEAMLGETLFSVTDEKVSILELRVHAISGLALSIQPSPGNSHTMVAKATGLQTLTAPKQEASLSIWLYYSDSTASPLTFFDPKDYNLNASTLNDKVVYVSQEPQQRWPVVVAEGEGSGEIVRMEMTICEACQKTKRKSIIASAPVYVKVRFGPEEDSEEEMEIEIEPARVTRQPVVDSNIGGGGFEPSNEQPASVPIDYTNFPTISNQERPTEGEEEEEDDDFIHAPRSMTDLEIGMYALLGVFCLAILVFLINCIVFVLKYRHKRIPPEGQANMDHSHHWVFLGNGQPLRAQSDLSPQTVENPINPMEGLQTCCHGDHHSSGSSQTSVQSQVHGRGDGSSGGSTKEHGEEASSPTSKRKRVKFTTFTTLPTEDMPYNSIPIADEEDIQWVCQDMGFQDPEELHDYMRRIKEIA